MTGKADQARWNEALYGGNDTLLRKLVDREPPDISLFQLAGCINGLYRRRDLLPWTAADRDLRTQIVRATTLVDEIRSNLAAKEQRQIDLAFLRFVRHSGCLSVVIGAGASKAAGGPLWGELIEELIKFTLKKNVPPHIDRQARQVLARIETGKANFEDLTHGAQLLDEFWGQHVFTHMYGSLYNTAPKPGPIHDAIAELAKLQVAPDRRSLQVPGWGRIITYNYDDLMGEALDACGLPRAAWAMRGDKVKGDPNQIAIDESTWHVPILHLHGHTPRKLFRLTQVQFVFCTTQYKKVYGGVRVGILKQAFEECLANPIDIALYVGCSFTDDYMNDLLREATELLPGRRHFALLQWPGNGDPLDSAPGERARHEARYHQFGVQPIWFKEFKEIPALIRSLA